MATCPSCGVDSREPEAMTARMVLVASPVLGFSLAGIHAKFTARERVQLSCRCGWSVIGEVLCDASGPYLVADPRTEIYPVRRGAT